jgi:hypothetical protein
MKNTILSLCFCLALIQICFSKQVSCGYAETVAKNIYYERVNFNNKLIAYEDIIPILAFTSQYKSTVTFYVFNIRVKNISCGFVIVSANDDAYPVLGYSFENYFKSDSIPSSVKIWLDFYSEQISYINTNHLKADSSISLQWEKYSTINNYPLRNTNSVDPLLKTVWGQGTYYNTKIPYNCPVGCVALAMGEVMKYYNYPPKGIGYHSYTSNVGYLSANFGNTYYNFDRMPLKLDANSSTTQINVVSTLLLHCGVSVETYYTSNGSGSNIFEIPAAIKSYFNYYSADYVIKGQYLEETWQSMLKGQIDRKNPLIYSGHISENGTGHAFVCDGYQSGSPFNSFHFNWGWDGLYNGYFLLNSLNPGTIDLTYSQRAIINIIPSKVALIDYIELSTNTVKQYSSLNINAKITNFDPINYIGNIDAVLLDSTGSIVLRIDSVIKMKLIQDFQTPITFKWNKAIVPKGNYKIQIRYQNSNGTMSILPSYLFVNPVDIQVTKGYPGNTISLDTLITISAKPIKAYDSFSVNVNLINYDTINEFNGDIAAGFWDTIFNTVDLIDIPKIGVTLLPLMHSTFNYHCNTFFKYDGMYKIGMFYRKKDAGEWAFCQPGLYTNPILVKVLNTSSINDYGNYKYQYYIYQNSSLSNLTIVKNSNISDAAFATIYSIQGHEINSFQLLPFKTVFDVTNLINGIYVLKINNNKFSEVFKFVKK